MYYLSKITTVAQTAWWSIALTAAGAYLAPLYEIIIVLFAMVAVDFVVGLMASRKKLIPWSSRRFRLSIYKLISYLVVIVLIYAIERAVDVEWVGSVKFMSGFICLVELVSILENLAILTEHPIFLKIIRLVRGKAASKQGSLIDDILEEKNETKTPKTK